MRATETAFFISRLSPAWVKGFLLRLEHSCPYSPVFKLRRLIDQFQKYNIPFPRGFGNSTESTAMLLFVA
jgi:hypothetical protein